LIGTISSEILAVLLLLVGVIAVLAFTFYKNKKSISELQLALINTENALLKKQSKAYQIGANTELGNIHEILGEFKMLTEYDELITLSTTSKAPSLDMIGIKDDRMDFLEFKKKGAVITPKEKKIRSIIENKNVNYVVKDIDIPKEITVETRKLKPLKIKSNTDGSNTVSALRSEQ
tara:strand:+ start:1608 stop:2135 length:528 start_codon:yes stop_codon:yes gene_type:complete